MGYSPYFVDNDDQMAKYAFKLKFTTLTVLSLYVYWHCMRAENGVWFIKNFVQRISME